MRAMRLVGLALLFVMGFLMPYALVRIGWAPALAVAAATIVASEVFSVMVRRILESDQASSSVIKDLLGHAGGRSLLLAVVVVAIGVVSGLALTERPSHVAAEPVPVVVPYDQSPKLRYRVYLDALASCQRGFVSTWGSRRYGVDSPAGFDVVGWQGTLSNLQPVPFEGSIFGQAPMDDVAIPTSRVVRGAVCLRGRAVPWGYDNRPNGKQHNVLWESGSGGWAELVDPRSEERAVLDLLQDVPSGSVYILTATARADRSIDLSCAMAGAADAGSRVFSQPSAHVAKLNKGETYVGATIAGEQIVVMSKRDVGSGDEYHTLTVRMLAGCRAGSSKPVDLQALDGSIAFNTRGESLLVGPSGQIVVSSMSNLVLREFIGGREQGRTLIDPGYDPDSSGAYGLVKVGASRQPFALIWASGATAPVGKSSENLIVPLTWERSSTRCARRVFGCLPGGQRVDDVPVN